MKNKFSISKMVTWDKQNPLSNYNRLIKRANEQKDKKTLFFINSDEMILRTIYLNSKMDSISNKIVHNIDFQIYFSISALIRFSYTYEKKFFITYEPFYEYGNESEYLESPHKLIKTTDINIIKKHIINYLIDSNNKHKLSLDMTKFIKELDKLFLIKKNHNDDVGINFNDSFTAGNMLQKELKIHQVKMEQKYLDNNLIQIKRNKKISKI